MKEETIKCAECKKDRNPNLFDQSKHLGRRKTICKQCECKICSRCGGGPKEQDVLYNKGKLSMHGDKLLCADCYNEPFVPKTVEDLMNERSFVGSCSAIAMETGTGRGVNFTMGEREQIQSYAVKRGAAMNKKQNKKHMSTI